MTTATVSDGKGSFMLFPNGNVQLYYAVPGSYTNVGKTWTPGSAGYNDILWSLATAYPENRSKMEKAIGSVALTKALSSASGAVGSSASVVYAQKSSGVPTPSFLPVPVAPSMPAPSVGSQPATGPAPSGITEQSWFWPVVGVASFVAVGLGSYFVYTRYTAK